MNPVQQAEDIARSKAKIAGKDFDKLSESQKERLRQEAIDEVAENKASDD